MSSFFQVEILSLTCFEVSQGEWGPALRVYTEQTSVAGQSTVQPRGSRGKEGAESAG